MNSSDRSEKALKIAQCYRGEVDGKVKLLGVMRWGEEIFPDFPDMTEEYLLADVMSRPGLTLREHSMIIITTLMANRFEGGLKGHMNWALNVGLSREEVSEIIMHASRFGGWPTGEAIHKLINEAYPEFLENSLEKVWVRPGLTPRERSIITMAAFIALRFNDRLRVHIAWALDNDISREDILEIIIQVTPFSGWPIGVGALRIAREVFSSKEEK